MNQYFVIVWHQHDVLSLWHLAYASPYAIVTILTYFCLQTSASNEK
jgi:hypothetical protein